MTITIFAAFSITMTSVYDNSSTQSILLHIAELFYALSKCLSLACGDVKGNKVSSSGSVQHGFRKNNVTKPNLAHDRLA